MSKVLSSGQLTMVSFPRKRFSNVWSETTCPRDRSDHDHRRDSLGLISLFSFETFSGWVAYGLMCLIPTQIVVAVLWKAKSPTCGPRATGSR